MQAMKPGSIKPALIAGALLLALAAGVCGYGIGKQTVFAEPPEGPESGSRLRISASIDDSGAYTQIAAGNVKGFRYDCIPCYGLTDVTIEIEGNTLPLEDAITQGQITAEEMIAFARIDAENGFCQEKASSQLGLSSFLYTYPEYELEVIYDVYETPDGNQPLIKLLGLYPVGKSRDFSHAFTDGEGNPIDREDWGISLELVEISSGGATVRCVQSGGQQLGQLKAEAYSIASTTDNRSYSGTLSACPAIQSDGTTQISVDWAQQHGQIPSGDYLIKIWFEDIYDKDLVHPLMQNFTDNQSYCIEVTIP